MKMVLPSIRNTSSELVAYSGIGMHERAFEIGSTNLIIHKEERYPD